MPIGEDFGYDARMSAASEEVFILALDVGSSSVRAAVFDARGVEVGDTYARVPREFRTTREGGSEADAEELLSDVAGVIDATLARSGPELTSRFVAVATACFWHSLVGVDAQGRAATPVYGWADTRAADEAEALRHELDERETHARTGCRLHPSYWPAKLRWVRRENETAWRASARWMSFGEYLTLRLCGETAASVSMASGTGLFDQHVCDWDAPLVGLSNLNSSQLPALARDGRTFTLAGEFAGRWPQLRGVPFFPPVADGAANNVGEGCASRERAALMVGTSAAMRVVYEGSPPGDLDEGLWCYRLDRRRVVVGGALSDGGGLFDWMRGSLTQAARSGEDPRTSPSAGDVFESRIAAIDADAHGLTVLPFWFGERSTGWNPRARGSILGMTAHTTPAEIARAAMESVAYRLALIAEALLGHADPRAEIRASGGALHASSVWAQIIADALNRPLKLSRATESSSRGAVLLALEALGELKSVSDVPVPQAQTIEPDDSRHEVYARAIERQQKFYRLLVNTR